MEAKTPAKHTFTVTVDVDPFWVDYLTKHSDIFMNSRSGYWLFLAEIEDDRGILCYEMHDEHRPSDESIEEATTQWLAGKPLPDYWFKLDRAAALKAWEEGVKRWGVNWYEQVDAEREDIVVQLALLGELRYG